MTGLVVCWDSDINELSRGIGITESNDGNVDVGCFTDSLSVGAGIGDNDQTWLLERASDVVGEVTGREATSNGNGSSMSSELEDSTLTVRTGGDDTDISWVVDSCDDAGCEDDFLPVKFSNYVVKHQTIRSSEYIPGLANVDHIDSIRSGLPQVRFHVNLHVLRSQVTLSCKKHLNVLRRRIENRRELRRRHLCDLTSRIKSCGLMGAGGFRS